MVNITVEITVTLVPVAKYTLIDLYSILKAAFVYGASTKAPLEDWIFRLDLF